MTAWTEDPWAEHDVHRQPAAGSPLEGFMADAEKYGDELDAALAAEEIATAKYLRAEAIATATRSDEKVAATILPKLLKADIVEEAVALNAAEFARKRAYARLSTTTDLITAESSRLKHYGVVDGGPR